MARKLRAASIYKDVFQTPQWSTEKWTAQEREDEHLWFVRYIGGLSTLGTYNVTKRTSLDRKETMSKLISTILQVRGHGNKRKPLMETWKKKQGRYHKLCILGVTAGRRACQLCLLLPICRIKQG